MDHNAIGARAGRLAHLGLLRFSGADAHSFLQGQLSNDTERLAQGAALMGALSSPQGRVLAVLTLLPHSSGVVAILPAELVPAIGAQLRKYVLRAKVRIEEGGATGLVVAGLHGGAAPGTLGLPAPREAGNYCEDRGVGVARLNEASERYFLVGAAEVLGDLAAADAKLMENDWRLADIRAGLPQVYAATSNEFVAQMLNLDLVDGISFTKGCYTGQEIIARTQHLGRIKRRMFRLAIEGALPAGQAAVGVQVLIPDGRGGRVTEIASTTDGHEALAVLPLDAGAPGAPGIAAKILPLPYASPSPAAQKTPAG